MSPVVIPIHLGMLCAFKHGYVRDVICMTGVIFLDGQGRQDRLYRCGAFVVLTVSSSCGPLYNSLQTVHDPRRAVVISR